MAALGGWGWGQNRDLPSSTLLGDSGHTLTVDSVNSAYDALNRYWKQKQEWPARQIFPQYMAVSEEEMMRAEYPLYMLSDVPVNVPPKQTRKCKSCKEDEHNAKFDLIGYCEKRLEEYYANLKKIVSNAKTVVV